MTQSVPRIFSPSSLRMTRSTPCVEGCCGPMLRTSSVESRKVSGMFLLPALDPHVLLHPARVLLQDAVILAQRVTLPVFRHQNAPQVRMAGEADAEHIEHLALQPIRRQVHAGCGARFKSIRNLRLDTHALVVRK